jgi:hypothetical protein
LDLFRSLIMLPPIGLPLGGIDSADIFATLAAR